MTVPVPNCSGRGTPTCQGMEQSWGGGGTAWLQHGAPHSWCPQDSSTSPPRMPGALLLHWGVTGDPHSSAGCLHPYRLWFCLGGPCPASRCAGWGGTGPSGWIQAPPARDPLPSPSLGLFGAGLSRCPLPWLAAPHIWPYVPGGGCVCPPTPCPGSSSRWDSRIMVLSTLDSLLFSNCCYRLGWGGLQSPPCMGTPVCSLLVGLGGSGPRGTPSWPLCAPGPADWAVGTQKPGGPPPKLPGGWRGAGGTQPEPPQLQFGVRGGSERAL